jgi:hypothetical protein
MTPALVALLVYDRPSHTRQTRDSAQRHSHGNAMFAGRDPLARAFQQHPKDSQ